ncbi:MAG: helix-hairpin-helix domain-containing protein [Actinomycetota bacterium]|nr:helix-hairpin-helix domain-containing protein [Actinomycetota bacterium]
MRTELPVREIVVESGWRERLEAFAGRRRDSWVLLAVMVGAVVLGLLLWARGAPATVAPPARSAPRERGAFATTVTPSPEPVLLVHVAGAVRRPGLYEMPAGARVADAVQAARGPTPRADLDGLNLAEPLQDGLKVEVVRRGEVPAMPASSPQPGTSTTAPATPVNVNIADQAALETIPEIGPVTAAAILDYRSQAGSFSSVEELLEVSGVGPATLEAMRPYVTV